MGQHHALRLAGGAGGVDQSRRILWFDRPHQRVKDRITIRASSLRCRYQLPERNRTLGDRTTVHDHDPLERRLLAHRVQLVEQWARGHHGNLAARVAHQCRYLLAGQRGIDRHIDGPDRQHRKVGHRPLPAVLADQRYTVALLRSPGQQRCGQRLDTVVDLVRRDRQPIAELVLPQHRARVGRRGNAEEQIVDRVERSFLGHVSFAIGPAANLPATNRECISARAASSPPPAIPGVALPSATPHRRRFVYLCILMYIYACAAPGPCGSRICFSGAAWLASGLRDER